MICNETKRIGLPQIAWILTIAMVISLPTTQAWSQDDSPIPEWLQQRLVDRVLHRRDSNAMMRLMHPIAEEVDGGIVEIISGGRPVALGTAVSSAPSKLLSRSSMGSVTQDASVLQDAYVVTKRSELSGDPIRVRLFDGRLIPARVAAVRRRSDLAMLVVQVDQATAARSLRPVRFDSSTPLIGSFLVSPDRTGRVIGLGVVGASPRKVGHQGRLGIELEGIGQTGARVRNIVPDSGADEAGLERGDRIIAIDGQNQSDLRQVVSTLNGMFPGEVVQLTIERDGSTVDIPARMSDLTVLQESENDARVNGARNARLSGFEQAIQHDTVLNPEQCGGPILDTEGRIIGLNIARAGRVVSYALPASLVASEVSSMIAEAGGK